LTESVPPGSRITQAKSRANASLEEDGAKQRAEMAANTVSP
jgi:hypothetical protein